MTTLLGTGLYDIKKTYEENYNWGPFLGSIAFPSSLPKKSAKNFLGFEINSPLGIAAGPLLNGRWVKTYADFGFDVPVYKTVRSVSHPCHPAPNCVYISPEKHFSVGEFPDVHVGKIPETLEKLAITNSFGVPSKNPSEWMLDIEETNKKLSEGQVMIVSVSGTPMKKRNLVEDYAYTATMAKEAGARIIEANFSCPNVCTGEGQIFQHPETAKEVCAAIRKSIGDSTPFLIKIGNLTMGKLEELIKKCRPFVDGFAGINTVSGNIRKADGTQALPGKGRLKSGFCGWPIAGVAKDFTKKIAEIRHEYGDDFAIISVGGIMTPADIDERLEMGSDVAMTATAAMWDPLLASRWRSS